MEDIKFKKPRGRYIILFLSAITFLTNLTVFLIVKIKNVDLSICNLNFIFKFLLTSLIFFCVTLLLSAAIGGLKKCKYEKFNTLNAKNKGKVLKKLSYNIFIRIVIIFSIHLVLTLFNVHLSLNYISIYYCQTREEINDSNIVISEQCYNYSLLFILILVYFATFLFGSVCFDHCFISIPQENELVDQI